VPDIVIATDAETVYDELSSVLTSPDTTVRWVRTGAGVRDALNADPADLAVVDMQIGTMGGVAVALDVRLEQDAGRLDPCKLLLVLDRRADVFLARRSGVDGWLVKPLDPIRIRRAVATILGGEPWHDPSYLPNPVSAPFGERDAGGASAPVG
jgi:DNA-binding response OmpR family regulator